MEGGNAATEQSAMCTSKSSMATKTSTSFAAQVPALSHAEFDRLRVWGEENCAASVLYRDGACVV